MNTCWSNIKISSYSSFWRLDFSEIVILKNIFDTRKIFDDKPFIFFFLNAANQIKFLSVISDIKLRYGPRIHFTEHEPPLQSEKFQPELSQYECFM